MWQLLLRKFLWKDFIKTEDMGMVSLRINTHTTKHPHIYLKREWGSFPDEVDKVLGCDTSSNCSRAILFTFELTRVGLLV